VALGGGDAGTGPVTRVRTGRLGAVVRWSDGPSAPAVATGHGYALDAAGGFFEGIGTLVLAGDGGRVFALLPVEPGVDPKAAVELAWGLGLCLRVSEAADGDAAVDAAVDAGEDEAVDAGDGD
jgi:hypothetical protein